MIEIALVNGGEISGSRVTASSAAIATGRSLQRAAANANRKPSVVPAVATIAASSRLFQKARS